MKAVRLVEIFPVQEAPRMHGQSYVEWGRTKCGKKDALR